MLNDFKSLSELSFKEAKVIILQYVSQIKMDEEEIENVVSSYPLEDQVKFYKIGGQNAIAQR